MKQKKGSALGIWLSRGVVAAALALLLYTCRWCVPVVGVWVSWAEESAAGQAFSGLCDALGEGESVKEAFSTSYRVLIGEDPS